MTAAIRGRRPVGKEQAISAETSSAREFDKSQPPTHSYHMTQPKGIIITEEEINTHTTHLDLN